MNHFTVDFKCSGLPSMVELESFLIVSCSCSYYELSSFCILTISIDEYLQEFSAMLSTTFAIVSIPCQHYQWKTLVETFIVSFNDAINSVRISFHLST